MQKYVLSLISSSQPCFSLCYPICSGFFHVDVGQLPTVATGLNNNVLQWIEA